jgi:predicted TIM-barrel fold metal-dependent hydrolase
MNTRSEELVGSPYEKRTLSDCFVVSADCHVNEPNDVWAARIEGKYKERLPQVKIDEKSHKWLVVEGHRPSRIREAPRDSGVAKEHFAPDGKRPQLDPTKGGLFQQQGGFTESRYRDMDYDGIDAEVVFPNKGLTNWASPDPLLNDAMCRAWNDWAHEIFSTNKRSYPVACIPSADVDLAVAEVERTAHLGFHSAMIPPLLSGRGYNGPEFDRLWAALSDAGLPILFHAGTGKDPRTAGGSGGALINYVVHAMNTVLQPVVELCSSGVFDRYPKLQFATIEAGVGWIPHMLHALDHGFLKHAFWVSPKLKERPSDYFRRHGHASFQDDPVGIETRHWLGVDCLLWGNDYPHIEGCWPDSSEMIGQFGAQMSTEERNKVIGLNAARLFNIDVPEKFRTPPVTQPR